MDSKKFVTGFGIFSLFLTVITGALCFVNSAFIPMAMLMLSLLLFTICYSKKDEDNKKIVYLLFTLGVMLIIGSLVYTMMRVM